MGNLGIQRVVAVIGKSHVRMRSQSRSQRGTMFTVGSAVETYIPGDRKSRETAITAAVMSLLVKESETP